MIPDRPQHVLHDAGPVPRGRHVLLLQQPGDVRVVQHEPQVGAGEPAAVGVQEEVS